MAKKFSSRPFVDDRPMGHSATIPNQGFTPSDWVKRLKSGLALPVEHTPASCTSEVDATLRRANLDLNVRRELIAKHKVKFSDNKHIVKEGEPLAPPTEHHSENNN